MKLSLIGLVAMTTITLTACQSTPKQEKPEMVGMANPASVFCVKQGGKLEARQDAQGNEYVMCHLPNGQVVEEWEYFRKHAPKN